MGFGEEVGARGWDFKILIRVALQGGEFRWTNQKGLNSYIRMHSSMFSDGHLDVCSSSSACLAP